MKISPLQLEHSVIEEVFLSPARETTEFSESLNITANPVFARHDTEPNRWQVSLEVIFSGHGDKPAPYTGKIKVSGWFRVVVDNSIPEDKQLAVLTVNAASIMYSSVREILAGLTARGLNGLFLLPSVSFADLRITAPVGQQVQPA